MTITLANGGPREKRRELDFYPTPPDATQALLDFLKLPPKTLIWECACGDGAMSEVLTKNGYSVFSTDIRDTGYGGKNYDYLRNPVQGQFDAIITNPPFSDSEAFIRKAVNEAPLVAMLLKSQYWHAQKRQALFEETRPVFVLPLSWRPDFMGGERGGAPTMEVLWTVWKPSEGRQACKYQPLRRPVNV